MERIVESGLRRGPQDVHGEADAANGMVAQRRPVRRRIPKKGNHAATVWLRRARAYRSGTHKREVVPISINRERGVALSRLRNQQKKDGEARKEYLTAERYHDKLVWSPFVDLSQFHRDYITVGTMCMGVMQPACAAIIYLGKDIENKVMPKATAGGGKRKRLAWPRAWGETKVILMRNGSCDGAVWVRDHIRGVCSTHGISALTEDEGRAHSTLTALLVLGRPLPTPSTSIWAIGGKEHWRILQVYQFLVPVGNVKSTQGISSLAARGDGAELARAVNNRLARGQFVRRR
jgi:hypothetical protein